MAITGLTLPTEALAASPRSDVDEAVDVTVELLKRLGVVGDEQSLKGSLASDYQRLAELGGGRLYVELPAAVTFSSLVVLANELAARAGYEPVYQWPNFWVPGTEKESVTEDELNGSAAGYTARLALYSDNEYDRLLHFGGLPYDNKYANPGEATQLDKLAGAQADFAAEHAGASLRACDHRDFLVWYIMDLIRGVPANKVVLAQGYMRVPALGRRTVIGASYVGLVSSSDGWAGLGGSHGNGYGGGGVGVSAGFLEA